MQVRGLDGSRGSSRFAAVALLFIVSGGDLAPAVGAQTADPAELCQKVDLLAGRTLDGGRSGRVAGLSVGVHWRGETLLAKGYGFADLEHDVPATEQTVYRIGSVTKQFTTAAVMQLVEEGKVALDDTVAKLAPEFETGAHTVTLRQLLNHTSGIPSYTGVPAIERTMRGVNSAADVLALVSGRPFDFAPGDEFLYNNTGLFLAGEILARVDGRPYDEVIAARIFTPLSMTGSGYGWEQSVVKRRAQGYRYADGRFVNDEPIDMRVPGGAGALASTVVDLLRWATAMQELEVVGDASYAEMTAPTRLNDGTTVDYGFGLALGQLDGHASVGHGGNINGFNSFIEWYPDDALAIAVLVNTEGNSATDLTRRIARLFWSEAAAAPSAATAAKELPLTAEELARCTGSYRRGARELVLAADAGHLTAKLGDQAPAQLELLVRRTGTDAAGGALEFRFAADPSQRLVVATRGDLAESALLVGSGAALKFLRAPAAPAPGR